MNKENQIEEMATCKDCFHWEACKMMCEAMRIIVCDDFQGSADRCDNFLNTADVAPRAEVAREIYEELRRYIINHCYLADDDVDAIWKHIDMLEKKYTEAEPSKGE